jgi:predicted NUDIX family NTP pyrophosphohydrolase
VDEARWFTLAEARAKILKSQAPILDALEKLVIPGLARDP